MASGALSSTATSTWLVGLAVNLAVNPCQFLIKGGLVFFFNPTKNLVVFATET
jgi:hypothetical protein